MNKILSVFLVLNFILYSSAFAKKTSAELAEENATADSAVEEFLTKCFQDYLKQLSKPNEKVKKRCVSIPFRTEWKKIATLKNIDPLLLVETPSPAWKSQVEIVDANARLKSAKVLIGEDEEQLCLKVKIDKTEDDLKISSTRKCAN